MAAVNGASISQEWARVCDAMDAARQRYCEAAKPVVAVAEAAAARPHVSGPLTADMRALVAASDEWALTVAAVNAFARKHLHSA